MEFLNNELKDKIITSKGGIEFIFPVNALDTIEKIQTKIVEYAEIARIAELNGDLEELKRANKMLELLTTQKFSTNAKDCQIAFIENGFLYEPVRSPEERNELKSSRYRKKRK